MKVVNLDDIKEKLEEFIDRARTEDIIVTKKGRAAVLIHGLTGEELEEYLFENDPRFAEIIQARRERYRREGGIPLESLARELGIETR